MGLLAGSDGTPRAWRGGALRAGDGTGARRETSPAGLLPPGRGEPRLGQCVDDLRRRLGAGVVDPRPDGLAPAVEEPAMGAADPRDHVQAEAAESGVPVEGGVGSGVDRSVADLEQPVGGRPGERYLDRPPAVA